jgi:hypothetical protein
MKSILKKLDQPLLAIFLFLFLYGLTTFSIWRKYNMNPSSMVNFGKEYVEKNKEKTPSGIIMQEGYKGDLGAGYDGQIFYYFSRTVSDLSLNWPKGFDESYRAPRIGYPLLIGLFGIYGKWCSIFGMYFWNLFLFITSFILLRKILDADIKYLSLLYLLSPFSLGSYSVLVSDTVMVSLVIISYYFYLNSKNTFFVFTASLAILCKEPALFFFFPLGLKALTEKRISKILLIASILIIPILWQVYLRFTFPNWRATRLTDFILPLEGILKYLKEMTSFEEGFNLKNLARQFSRLPLLLLLLTGLYTVFTGKLKEGFEFRISLLLVFFMISTASYYHFWSVYENVSRMFTLSIPVIILLKNEDKTIKENFYSSISLLILFLFLIKVMFIQKIQLFTIYL